MWVSHWLPFFDESVYSWRPSFGFMFLSALRTLQLRGILWWWWWWLQARCIKEAISITAGNQDVFPWVGTHASFKSQASIKYLYMSNCLSQSVAMPLQYFIQIWRQQYNLTNVPLIFSTETHIICKSFNPFQPQCKTCYTIL